MARHEMTLRRVVYEIPGMEAVTVLRDVEDGRSHAGPLTTDLYYQGASSPDLMPPVAIIVGGFADVGVPLTLGCAAKEMEMVTKVDPAGDAKTLMQHLWQHGPA